MRDDGCPDCLRLLLQGRSDYLAKPDPTRWKSGDVRELLLELAVTRITDVCDLVGHGVDSMRSCLRFLDQTGWLHPGSATMKVLRRELERVAPAYPQAMADTSRWRLAKRLYTAMRAARVDLDNETPSKLGSTRSTPGRLQTGGRCSASCWTLSPSWAAPASSRTAAWSPRWLPARRSHPGSNLNRPMTSRPERTRGWSWPTATSWLRRLARHACLGR
jgi:hypothetical protein